MKIFAILNLLLLTACASVPSNEVSNVKQKDPLEGLNRVVFKFNDGIDSLLLKPAAKAYRAVTPNIVENGITNFFDNLREVPSLVNAGLQGKAEKSLTHTGRFLVNSTLGILGFIDLAQHMGLEKEDSEDFGQTLGTWGVQPGPYLVIPFLGPSTLRDGIAIPVDTYTDLIDHVDHNRTQNSLKAGNLIEIRAGLLDSERLITGDRYIFIRDAYLQRRNFLIQDGQVSDSFGSSLEEEDF
ncbi:MAG: phospholipid-binding lipoprotein MlaA [Cellvibrionaceae bacterium]|jgi:phospholipid-binding lipoprotein MlaA